MAQLPHSYFSGAFDGEGCILIVSKKDRSPGHSPDYVSYGLQVVVANTCLPLLEAFKAQYGGSILANKRYSLRHAPKWTWKITGTQKAAKALQAWLPWMIVKREEAVIAFEFAALSPAKGHGRRQTDERRAECDSYKQRLIACRAGRRNVR